LSGKACLIHKTETAGQKDEQQQQEGDAETEGAKTANAHKGTKCQLFRECL
jgi:hypothetical protein